ATVNNALIPGSNLLADDSAERLVDDPAANAAAGVVGTNGILDVGDRLVGIVSFHQTSQGALTVPLGGASANNELTGIFSIQVLAKNDTGVAGLGRFQFVFGPTTAANFLGDTGVTQNNAGTMVAMFDDPANNFNRGLASGAAQATATGGTRLWSFGI